MGKTYDRVYVSFPLFRITAAIILLLTFVRVLKYFITVTDLILGVKV